MVDQNVMSKQLLMGVVPLTEPLAIGVERKFCREPVYYGFDFV